MSFGNSDAVSFDFGINVDKLEPNYRYFSLLIGNNGAGKSSLLRKQPILTYSWTSQACRARAA